MVSSLRPLCVILLTLTVLTDACAYFGIGRKGKIESRVSNRVPSSWCRPTSFSNGQRQPSETMGNTQSEENKQQPDKTPSEEKKPWWKPGITVNVVVEPIKIEPKVAAGCVKAMNLVLGEADMRPQPEVKEKQQEEAKTRENPFPKIDAKVHEEGAENVDWEELGKDIKEGLTNVDWESVDWDSVDWQQVMDAFQDDDVEKK